MDQGKKNGDKLKLTDIERKNIYKIPENYFENLPMKIASKVRVKTKESFFLILLKRPSYMVPACIFIAFIIYMGVIKKESLSTRNMSIVLLKEKKKNIVTEPKDSVMKKQDVKVKIMKEPEVVIKKVPSKTANTSEAINPALTTEELLADIEKEDILFYLDQDQDEMEEIMSDEINQKL